MEGGGLWPGNRWGQLDEVESHWISIGYNFQLLACSEMVMYVSMILWDLIFSLKRTFGHFQDKWTILNFRINI